MNSCINQPVLFQSQTNEIHLWFTKPNTIHQTGLLKQYRSLLSEQEILKQQSYVFPNKRHNELITRSFIRNILSHYINIHPSRWQFKKDNYNKPKIIQSLLPLQFNISHSDDLILCAITQNNEIGCDVESINRNCNFLSIAKNIFSIAEYSDLINTPVGRQRSRFFDYWTLKESYVKACGLGFAMYLADFGFRIGETKSKKFNDNIQLEYKNKHSGHPVNSRSWLFRPNKRHRIAISIKANSFCQTKEFKFRFFENIPLYKTTELNELNFNG
ncbi:4'-phosphopantetheinyl transferase [Nitrosomonas sp. Nm51]|uniref:4'-phosphopantetheinyl transferase family protein n=1 Tax=Nitrosomonas sp. Nm51 TaxID=133720 RepID=UPI0008D1647F|nr:4'-phosphopantetheinyl transferase superfamily protein [Nitrosomonas sp. Nm51]SEQ74945.1 4'-phosphopantetheinyl transferase [Nitrosomonas sp. Nm51]